MKHPSTLKTELLEILRGHPTLKVVPFPDRPWTETDLDEAAWIVQDIVNGSYEVVEDDNRLRDWLDSYKFRRATKK